MENQSKIKEVLKKVPLKTRLKVCIEAHLLVKNECSFFASLDDDGNEIPDEKREIVLGEAKELEEIINNTIDKWIKDGRPE